MGRFLFGLGGECFGVAHSALLTDWFKGKELAFSFGVTLAVTNIGTVINNLLSVALTEHVGLPFAFWFGSICTAISVASVIAIIPIDIKMESTIAHHNDQQIALTKPSTGSVSTSVESSSGSSINNNNRGDSSSPYDPEEEYFAESASLIPSPQESGSGSDVSPPTFKDVCSLSNYFWILVFCTILVYGCVLPFHNILSSFLLERDYFREQPFNCQLIISGRQDERNVPNSHCLTDYWYQPPLPYDITIEGKYYSHVYAEDVDCSDPLWRDVNTVEYCAKQVYAEAQASLVMSVPSILAFFTSAPVGYFIDRMGYRAVICTVAPLILIFVHLWLGLTHLTAIIPLLGLGVSYITFVSVLWPSIPLVVEDRLTGLSFGIMTSVMNLSIAVFPIIVAAIYDWSNYKYIPNVEWLFVLLAVIGTFVGFHLNAYDAKHGSILNRGYVAAKEEQEE